MHGRLWETVRHGTGIGSLMVHMTPAVSALLQRPITACYRTLRNAKRSISLLPKAYSRMQLLSPKINFRRSMALAGPFRQDILSNLFQFRATATDFTCQSAFNEIYGTIVIPAVKAMNALGIKTNSDPVRHAISLCCSSTDCVLNSREMETQQGFSICRPP